MIESTTPPPETLTLAQNAAQAHPDPFIQELEDRCVAVLEICKPAPDRAIHICNQAGVCPKAASAGPVSGA